LASAILLSGGIDSIALAHWTKPELAITVDYGQVCASAEANAAREAAAAMGLAHELIQLDCSSLGSGSLASAVTLATAPTPEWWPYRNQLLITLALMRVIRSSLTDLLIGTVAGDDRHADGRPEFVRLVDDLVSMQEGGVRVRAPAIKMSSEQLVRASGVPRSILGWAHSCHRGNQPCGECRGCFKHAAVLEGLGWI
jgi:7-cyano-7-deazaguanine synthase